MSRSRVHSFAILIVVALAILLDDVALSFTTNISPTPQKTKNRRHVVPVHYRYDAFHVPSSSSSSSMLHIFKTNNEDGTTTQQQQQPPTTSTSSIEETTEKFGLEVGLYQSLQSQDGGTSAKSLLAKYGIAYLATSIPLALLSFTLCYILVDNGVDVSNLLSKVGITNLGNTGEKAGTFAIAYAAHKAASPIRFPPTVLLTPIVAKLIGKEPKVDEEMGE